MVRADCHLLCLLNNIITLSALRFFCVLWVDSSSCNLLSVSLMLVTGSRRCSSLNIAVFLAVGGGQLSSAQVVSQSSCFQLQRSWIHLFPWCPLTACCYQSLLTHLLSIFQRLSPYLLRPPHRFLVLWAQICWFSLLWFSWYFRKEKDIEVWIDRCSCSATFKCNETIKILHGFWF